jgi:hypothetical protein
MLQKGPVLGRVLLLLLAHHLQHVHPHHLLEVVSVLALQAVDHFEGKFAQPNLICW